MIPRTPTDGNAVPAAALTTAPTPGSWRRELAGAITDPAELLHVLELDPELLPDARTASRLFALRVPRGFVARMRPGDPADPLLRQVLPLGDELTQVEGFGPDPLGEAAASPAPGLLTKYRGRALVIVAGACGVNCRYCFRRHFPYADHRLEGAAWEEVVERIRADGSLREVLLSGGEPLLLNDARLRSMARDLAAVPHLERLRVHTRLPVVLPSRVDDDFVAWLTGTRLRSVVVLHANHPREIGPEVAAAADRLRRAGVTVLNQAVLLRGVNDRIDVLAQLSETLFAAGILPYYLHLLDRVAGAAHFEVADDEARRLHGALRDRLPGYLVPKLVREVAGEAAKTPIPS